MPAAEPTTSIEAPSKRAADTVLTRALLRAGQRLALQQKQLAPILGVSPASLSRLSQGRCIRSDSKEGELAILFVRLFRSLDALVGGNETAGQQWFYAHNRHLDGVPAELVRTVQGLVRAVEYLDAMRGKV